MSAIYKAVPACPAELDTATDADKTDGNLGWVVVKGPNEQHILFGDGYMDEGVARRRADALNEGRVGTDVPNISSPY